MKGKMNEKMKGVLLIAVFILSTITLAIPLASASGNRVLTRYPTLEYTAKANAEWATWTTETRTVIELSTDAGGFTAAWDTEKEFGSYSAKLTQHTSGTGNAHVQISPISGTTITFGDLDGGVANEWSYWYKSTDTAHPWIYFTLRFQEPGSANCIDIVNQKQYPETTWTEFDLDTSDTWAIIFPLIGDWGTPASFTLATAYDEVDGELAGINGYESGDADDWELIMVNAHVYEGTAKSVYIDDITINGVTYAIEPVDDGLLYGAKLTQDSDRTVNDYAYVRAYPELATAITLGGTKKIVDELDTISFDYWVVSGARYPDIELIFEDPISDGLVEITLYQETWTSHVGWQSHTMVGDKTVAYGVTSTGASIEIAEGHGHDHTLAAMIVELTVLDSTIGTWELTTITPQNGWGLPSGVVYIDNIKIDDTGTANDWLEDFEPQIMLDFNDYKMDDIVTATVFDIGLNTRILVKDSGEFIATSDLDQITVDLLETDFYTSIFEGTFTLVDATPGTNELLTGHANATIAHYDRDGVIAEITFESEVDAEGPVVTITSPSIDDNITDTTPIILATVVDDGSDIDIAWLSVDGIVRDTDASDGLRYDVPDVAPLTEETHTVVVYAIDNAGNFNETTWDFKVDTTDPTCDISMNITKPAVNQTDIIMFTFEFNEDMDGSAPTIEGNATVGEVYLDLFESEQGWKDVRTYTANYTVTAALDFNGTVLLNMTDAVDMAGNEMVTANITIYIDTVDPTAPGQLNATALADTIVLEWTASTDLGSGVELYEIYRGTTDSTITTLLGSVDHPIVTFIDTTVTASGTYFYEITAYDFAVNSATSDDANATFTATPTTAYNVTLAEDWNIFSVPLIPTNTSIEAVLADVMVNVTVVWSYQGGVWLRYLPDVPQLSTLTTIEDGVGYWIQMTDASTFEVTGVELPGPGVLPPIYSVTEGWNLIGFKSVSSMDIDIYLTTIPQTVQNAAVCYGWDATLQAYEMVYIAGAGSEDFVPGQGYWLYVSADASIAPPES